VRACLEAHGRGKVAPLDGGRRLFLADGALGFPVEAELEPAAREELVHRLDPRPQGAFEILAEPGADETALADWDGEAPPAGPAFLPGFRSWEIALGHHDPLTDIFLLGQILAAAALGLDFHRREDLQRFAAARGNLFTLLPELEPLLARLIAQMTEPSRHRRAQDLDAIHRQLERWRVDEERQQLDFRNLPGFRQRPLEGRRQLSLARLQERLFELSRRNRLLHFRPTLGSLDLTLGSVPLRADPQRLPANAIFRWSEELRALLEAGRPLRLAEKLRFADHPYLGPLLDRIGANARRDLAEFGYSQLRLVVAFLRWSNLKSPGRERYDSPLLLLPCRLEKKKGVRDSYQLQPLDEELTVNPVLRYLLRRLFGIDLPAAIGMEPGNVDRLYDLLLREIEAAGEKGISLEKIELPQASLVHQKARKRRDLYLRRLHLPVPDEPAGEPPPREEAPPEEGQPAIALERRAGEAPAGNAYRWEFDLCAATLANLRDRRMSLVQDYEKLVEDNPPNAAFDTLFSLEPRPLPAALPPLELAESWPILPWDPTQARAVLAVRDGRSWIVQGPPGTGKSQTIANLIADGIARGRKILFVCQKRAAIDVVFRRLEQAGLDPLLCRVYDSQADKKAVIQDFRRTYESFLAESAGGHAERRAESLLRIEELLAPLAALEELFCAAPASAGMPLGSLLEWLLAHPPSGTTHRVTKMDENAPLPAFGLFVRHAEELRRLDRRLAGGVYCRHPLAPLEPAAALAEQPPALKLRLAGLRRELELLLPELAAAGFPADGDWAELAAFTGLGLITRSLSEARLADLLDPSSPASTRLAAARQEIARLARRRDKAGRATLFWKESWPLEEVRAALAAAHPLEGRFFAFLQPSWWRLSRSLDRAYDFRRHGIRPTRVAVLEAREAELALAEQLADAEDELRQELGFAGSAAELEAAVEAGRFAWNGLPAGRRPPAGPGLDQRLAALAALAGRAAALETAAKSLLLPPASQLPGLAARLAGLENAMTELPVFLPCLEIAAGLPEELRRAVTGLPLPLSGLERASAAATAAALLAERPALERQLGFARAERLQLLDAELTSFRRHNAAAIVEQVAADFRRLAALANQLSSGLDPDRKELKKSVAQGRRLLEREFEKTMRHRSIRELLAEAGEVLLAMKPVFLMSPLSVADVLPLAEELFDLVIFDEASQIPLEEAVPAIFRAPQVLVVGDPMQLPPTRFFAARPEEELVPDVAPDDLGDAEESLLGYAAKSLPTLFLGWHYRSRSENLIAFSNAAFYQGRLLTVPDPAPPAAAPPDGEGTDLLLGRSVSFHRLPGIYAERRNPAEAAYVARLVRELLRRELGLSIGIVAFSEAQQGEIEEALERLAKNDPDFAVRLEAEWEREEDGQFAGLLVKNLENIQGDERDVVILSVCYGPDARGKMRMNFGPINQGGGERRLNVAFTRARRHMALVASIDFEAITNTYNDGASALRTYLRYAAALSAGKPAEAARALAAISEDGASRAAIPRRPLVEQVARELEKRGYLVELDLGRSRFRCDLAVRKPGEDGFRLAILVDRPEEGPLGAEDLFARDLLQPNFLRQVGWKVIRISSLDWYLRPAATLEELVAAIEAQADRA
jgi:hypothetical protein